MVASIHSWHLGVLTISIVCEVGISVSKKYAKDRRMRSWWMRSGWFPYSHALFIFSAAADSPQFGYHATFGGSRDTLSMAATSVTDNGNDFLEAL